MLHRILEGDVIMTDFISEHKKLIIGIIVYITLFFISMYISPWQLSNVNVDELILDTTNTVMDKIPVKIVFFGIYELCELLAYAQYGGFSENGMIMFFFSACAVFSYIMIIKQIVLNIYENGTAFELDIELGLDDVESIIFNYICDNVIVYIACLISFYIYTPIADWVNTIFSGGNFWIKALIVIFIILIVIIPSLSHLLLFLAYNYAVIGIAKLINYIDQLLNWNATIKAVLFFIIAALFIIVVNIIVNKLLDVLLYLSAIVFANVLKGIIGFVLIIIGIIVLCFVVSLVGSLLISVFT